MGVNSLQESIPMLAGLRDHNVCRTDFPLRIIVRSSSSSAGKVSSNVFCRKEIT
jgi:hypothetical protein